MLQSRAKNLQKWTQNWYWVTRVHGYKYLEH
jgi:hypothetical protein